MKVKTLKNVVSAVKISYSVFDTNGNFIDDFKVDYMGDRKKLDENLGKYLKYENCEVRNVSTCGEWLEISITKK